MLVARHGASTLYEVNNHKILLEEVAKRLSDDTASDAIEGIVLIKVLKNKEIELEHVAGLLTFYEWVGILDFVQDMIKGEI